MEFQTKKKFLFEDIRKILRVGGSEGEEEEVSTVMHNASGKLCCVISDKLQEICIYFKWTSGSNERRATITRRSCSVSIPVISSRLRNRPAIKCGVLGTHPSSIEIHKHHHEMEGGLCRRVQIPITSPGFATISSDEETRTMKPLVEGNSGRDLMGKWHDDEDAASLGE